MIENSMVVFRDCDNPWEDEHSCPLCCDEYFDEADSYKDEDEE